MTAIDEAHWRAGLAAAADPAVSAVLTVQTAQDWLRAEHAALRDEIDAVLLETVATRPGLVVDRIVPLSLPVTEDPAGRERHQQLVDAHAAWLWRLELAVLFTAEDAEYRPHCVIPPRQLGPSPLTDLIVVRRGDRWPDTEPARAALRVLTDWRTSPLSGRYLDLDGPRGDADPSIYL